MRHTEASTLEKRGCVLCGCRIVVVINGRHKRLQDDAHDLCRQCWQAEKDRNRQKEIKLPKEG
jgi:hypothetical protein